MNYTGPGRVELSYEMPLAEVIFDFYDRFKSVTQGYGSFDYDIIDYRESNLVLMDILVNSEKVRCPLADCPSRSCPFASPLSL